MYGIKYIERVIVRLWNDDVETHGVGVGVGVG